MAKSISEKLGIRPGMKVFLKNAPDHFHAIANLPQVELKTRLAGAFDYIHLFTETEKNFRTEFPRLKKHLERTGVLWVSWPKAGQRKTELTIKTVIEMGYQYGLVESKAISIDTTWSALKFTHPKEGKVYHNSYGKLDT